MFPDAWSVKTLLGAHPSTPFNPAIANVFFRSGEIETWGCGIERSVAACTNAGPPKPTLIVDGTGIALEFRYTPEYLKAVNALESVAAPVGGQVTGQVTDPVKQVLLLLAQSELAPPAIQKAIGLSHRPTFRQNYLRAAENAGLVERTLPDKPNSRLQKYRLTAQGRAWLTRQRR